MDDVKTYTMPPTTGWTPKEVEALVAMLEQDSTDRSKFFRRLVRNEATRRGLGLLPTIVPEPKAAKRTKVTDFKEQE